MAEVQRSVLPSPTNVDDHIPEKRERRKSGIFFFNRSFKRSSTYKSDNSENNASSPTTPTLGPVKDGLVLSRTDSVHSIPALTQTSPVTAEAERPLSTSPPNEPLEALKRSAAGENQKSEAEDKPAGESVAKESEDLPTPPDTPGPSTTTPATTSEQAPRSSTSTSVDESTAPVPGASRKVSYHEDADLHIKVRETNGDFAVYSVRSSTLESASRVWKDALPSRTSDVIDVTDPAFGLDTIFSIAHYKFHDLPQRPDVSELYEIALVADKYETTHLLVPFAKEWVAGLNRHVLMAGARNDEDRTLVLAWVLGEARWFSRVLSKCAYKARIGPDGTLLDSEDKPWKDQPVSSEVLDIIAATRLDAIDRIIKTVSTPVHKLLNPQWYPGEEVRFCHAPEGDSAREDCEQLQLGSAIMGLSKAKLWPPPEPSRIKVSPVELARVYGDVRMRRYQVPGLRFKEGETAEDVHAKCGFGHREAVEKILNTPSQLTPSVVEQLQARAKKSGAFGDDLFEDLSEFLVEGSAAAADEDLKNSPVHYKQTTAKGNVTKESRGEQKGW